MNHSECDPPKLCINNWSTGRLTVTDNALLMHKTFYNISRGWWASAPPPLPMPAGVHERHVTDNWDSGSLTSDMTARHWSYHFSNKLSVALFWTAYLSDCHLDWLVNLNTTDFIVYSLYSNVLVHCENKQNTGTGTGTHWLMIYNTKLTCDRSRAPKRRRAPDTGRVFRPIYLYFTKNMVVTE